MIWKGVVERGNEERVDGGKFSHLSLEKKKEW